MSLLKQIGLALALSVSVVGVADAKTKLPVEITQQHDQMLKPAVKVITPTGSGSGTVISSYEEDGNWRTFVLTNYHVVDIVIAEGSFIGAPVSVEFSNFDGATYVGADSRLARVVKHNERMDLVLLELIDTSRGAIAATVAPKDTQIYIGEQVWTVGAGSGRPPFTTQGVVSYQGEFNNGYPYMITTAPIIFGNSGGGQYHLTQDEYQFIGVPSKVGMSQGTVVSHISWSIQLETIHTFLRGTKVRLD